MLPELSRRFFGDRSGVTAVLTALALTVVMGFVGLGTEVGTWYLARRGMQGAADQAALSADTALAGGAPRNRMMVEAAAISSVNGYSNGANGVTVTTNNPPTSGAYLGNAAAVEVVIQQTKPLLVLGLFLQAPVVVQARAVALTRPAATACVLGLDPSAPSTVSLSNNGVLSDPHCGVASNSNSTTSLALSNNAQINAPVSVVGSWSLSNNAALTGSPNIDNAPPVADPYAGITRQAAPACTGQVASGSNNVTANLNPGHFCSGISYSNNATVNLSPGTYYIDSQLVFGNNVVVNATGGVTLVIQGDYAINISNNAQINISAPSSGIYSGLAFFGDRSGLSTVQQIFSNNTALNIKGAIYFPNQIIQFDNNAETQPGGCTQIIGRKVALSNNVTIENNCTGVGTSDINIGAKAALVE
jgi:Flp pilus assembly protein TadG